MVLSSSDVQQIVVRVGLDSLMDELILCLQTAIAGYSDTLSDIPARSGFNYTHPVTGLIEWMPIHDLSSHHVYVKVVGYHPQNPSTQSLPTIVSTISGYHTHTGHLFGLIDGILPTSLRTGAASAVASRALAHPASKTLGLIGCGAQAVTQLHAISRVFDIEEVLYYDVDVNTALSFRERCEPMMGEAKLKFSRSTIEDLVPMADVLCTATSIEVGQGPLFENLPTKAHLHINAVGSDFPGKIEVPLDLLMKGFVCPDFRDQAIIEGECQQLPIESIGSSLTEVLDRPQQFDTYQEKVTVFDSTGWALEDQVVYGYVGPLC